ncbi:MAG: uroporphyrinogen-III synthase [Gammaproteobacteria bacterium]
MSEAADGPLSGTSVLVTRPQGLGEDLANIVRELGGTAVTFPAMAIEPVRPGMSVLAEMSEAPPGSLVIFVSRNAVAWGARYLPQPRPRIAAIGPSTARALGELGLTPDIRPEGFTSENLLAQPDLSQLSGVRVYIIRGEGGRETLAEGLAERGARVRYLEVYRRRPAPLSPERREEIVALWKEGGIDVYTATSVEIFRNLGVILGPDGAPLLRSTPLVTASERVLQMAERSDHAAERLLAAAPDDRSLADAIVRWRARGGGPPGQTGAE